MRNRIMALAVILAATLLFSSIASAQATTGSRDLSGVWMTQGYRLYR